MLEPHEIAYLEMLCPKYAEDFRAAIKVEWRREARRTKKGKKGQVHTPLKLHMMEVHVPQFARRWGSVGLFAEDAFESIHALWNKIMRSCACIPNLIERNEAGLNKLFLKQDKRLIAAGNELQNVRSAMSKGKRKAS